MKEEKTSVTLILKFISIDDFDCPTYKDQFGRLWKDIELGNLDEPSLYSVTGNELDGEPCYPIKQEYSFDPAPYRRNPHEFEYMLLSRLQSDCEYFLGYGNRNLHILLDENIQCHIERMKELWKGLPDDGKPEWLTWKQLLNYEKEMCNE